MNIQTRVAGIPATVRVLSYRPGYPGYFYGPPELCEPSYPAEMELEICDRRGRPAPWLLKKMTDQEWARLETEVEHYIKDDHDY